MLLTQSLVGLLVVVLVLLLCITAMVLRKLVWREQTQLATQDQHAAAQGIELAGFFFGCLIIAASALSAVSINDMNISVAVELGELSLFDFFGSVLVYGLLAMVTYVLIGGLSLQYLVRLNAHRGIAANNIAIAVVAGSSSVAHALVISAAISGETESPSILPPLIFFAIGIICLWACILLFRRLTSYDDNAELVHGNVAASLSYGGLMIALAMIIAHAVEGDFNDYREAFALFAQSMLPIVFLYPIRQVIVQTVLLRQPLKWYGGALDDRIGEHHDIGAGTIEAATYIAAAYLICSVTS